MQERRNSNATSLELRLSCTNPSSWSSIHGSPTFVCLWQWCMSPEVLAPGGEWHLQLAPPRRHTWPWRPAHTASSANKIWNYSGSKGMNYLHLIATRCLSQLWYSISYLTTQHFYCNMIYYFHAYLWFDKMFDNYADIVFRSGKTWKMQVARRTDGLTALTTTMPLGSKESKVDKKRQENYEFISMTALWIFFCGFIGNIASDRIFNTMSPG